MHISILFLVIGGARLTKLKAGVQRLGARLITSLLIVAGLVFVGMFVLQSIRIRDMQVQYDQKKQEFAQVQERNERLQQHLDFLKSPGYLLFVEKVAREKLGLAKPDETVILPVQTNPAAVASPEPTVRQRPPTLAKNKPIWQNWLGFFFGT